MHDAEALVWNDALISVCAPWQQFHNRRFCNVIFVDADGATAAPARPQVGRRVTRAMRAGQSPEAEGGGGEAVCQSAPSRQHRRTHKSKSPNTAAALGPPTATATTDTNDTVIPTTSTLCNEQPSDNDTSVGVAMPPSEPRESTSVSPSPSSTNSGEDSYPECTRLHQHVVTCVLVLRDVVCFGLM
eukprot:m.1160358 g.1160358  ORF g.1160358 m.1160358 type:complete len:186 (-) comp24501_c0_seq76:3663-4220(-)